jgi:hypothetical protein
MQTLKKLPQIAPKIPAAPIARGDDASCEKALGDDSQAALSAMPRQC